MYSVTREDSPIINGVVALKILSGQREIKSTEDIINLLTPVFRTLGEKATPPRLVEFFNNHGFSAFYLPCTEYDDDDPAHPCAKYDLHLNKIPVVRLSYFEFEYDGQNHLCPDFTPLLI